MDNHSLEISDVSRQIGDKVILSDISFSFGKKQIYTVLGPSGSGKSSLLRILNRLDNYTSGVIKYHNEKIKENWKEIEFKGLKSP